MSMPRSPFPGPELPAVSRPCTRRSWLGHAGLAFCAPWRAPALPAWLVGSSPARAADGNAKPQPPRLLLAKLAPADINPAPYLVSEKLDGVRAWWTGRHFLTRRGHHLPAPAWFTADLPDHALDGELWWARGRFDALSGLLRQADGLDDPRWRELSYRVFEWPDHAGPFSVRAEALHTLARQIQRPGLVAAEQRRVGDAAELQHWLAEVVAAGGEGLMLHRADAPYVTGRSELLLKLKPEQDAEAVVIAHLPGQGRHAGRLGALRVRSEDGRVFALGSGLPDTLREAPPPIGSVVVYRYRGLTPAGLPRFATFWRMGQGW